MKFEYLLAVTLFTSLISCGGESETPETPEKRDDRGRIIPTEVDYTHIITEAMTDYPTALRSDEDIELYDRDIMDIKLNKDGSFTIDGEKAHWEELEEEVNMFFKMNRKLNGKQTANLSKNQGYRGIDYPFFNQFTRESYQSYIDRLKKMAETDMKAGLYLQRHARSIKAFEAVTDEELAFMNPVAFIRYVYPDALAPEKLSEFEERLAKLIVEMRDEMAVEKFGINYNSIRNKASVDGDARRQLLYLQEMYPAYLLKLKESELEDVPEPPLEEPPMPTPPPVEEIIWEEDTD